MTQERKQRVAAAKPALAILGTFALALVAHGCATMDPSEEVRTEKEYRTGSNIPVRDRAGTGDAKSYDPTSVQDALQRSAPRAPTGLKGG
ncbi:MAG TPA: hypothetical protein VFO33_06670 [Casimicrobiaceae bacterium]|nr:hypothetical protein [Casimicrobiaceae bacterium]